MFKYIKNYWNSRYVDFTPPMISFNELFNEHFGKIVRLSMYNGYIYTSDLSCIFQIDNGKLLDARKSRKHFESCFIFKLDYQFKTHEELLEKINSLNRQKKFDSKFKGLIE